MATFANGKDVGDRCEIKTEHTNSITITDSMFTEQLPDLLDYVNSLPGFVCLVGDMNIHFDNPLQSLTKPCHITHHTAWSTLS